MSNELKKQTGAENAAETSAQVDALVIRRNDTPPFNENGAPFFCYCDGCGTPMYADEYTEQLDCLGLCDDCYLSDFYDERFDDEEDW